MKLSTTTASAILLSASNVANAFSPPSSHSFTQQQQTRTSSTHLALFPIDPALTTSAVESASIITSNGIVDGIGSLALIGSVGFGIAYSNAENKNWSYEYKVGNELSEGGTLGGGGSSTSVMEKVEEKAAPPAEKEPEAAAAVVEKVEETPKPVKAEAAPSPPKPAAAAAAKPKTPSEEILKSAEKAKAQVQKVGIEETKSKMSSKKDGTSSSSPSSPEEKVSSMSTTTEVAEAKKPGAKRRFAKGMALIVAAGGVTMARNVIKAYLGRGLL
mmetsp:Transcript_10009/g.21107  ORF Transcript_10009/g.21107 Transcript_10009/m.21107 type:complete len:272 (+) Transcript_10009:220-1035(+)